MLRVANSQRNKPDTSDRHRWMTFYSTCLKPTKSIICTIGKQKKNNNKNKKTANHTVC